MKIVPCCFWLWIYRDLIWLCIYKKNINRMTHKPLYPYLKQWYFVALVFNTESHLKLYFSAKCHSPFAISQFNKKRTWLCINVSENVFNFSEAILKRSWTLSNLMCVLKLSIISFLFINNSGEGINLLLLKF